MNKVNRVCRSFFSWTFCVILLPLCSISLSLAVPLPPVLSESFSADYQCQVTSRSSSSTWYTSGFMKIDHVNKRSVGQEVYSIYDSVMWSLDFYKLKITYSMNWHLGESSHGPCSNSTMNWTMPSMWDWVKDTVYNNTKLYNGFQVDVFVTKGVTLRNQQIIAVDHHNSNIVYYTRKVDTDNNLQFDYTYETFDPSPPNPKVFEIPKKCLT